MHSLSKLSTTIVSSGKFSNVRAPSCKSVRRRLGPESRLAVPVAGPFI